VGDCSSWLVVAVVIGDVSVASFMLVLREQQDVVWWWCGGVFGVVVIGS